MLAALLILSPTFAKVREISVFQKMETSITQGIEKKSELLSQPIYVVTDEEGNRTFFVDVTQDGVTERVNLETVIANSDMSGALKGKIMLWLAQKFIYKDGQSIGAVAGVFISDIVVAIVAYIAYCLALGLICWLLRKILQNARLGQQTAQSTRPHLRCNRIDGVCRGIYPSRACHTLCLA